MAQNYYYLVDFEAVCEECGKRFSGVIAQEVPVNDSALAGNILNTMADSVDANARKKRVENAVRDKRWSDLNLCYGMLQHECPHCRARQSWDPMTKPTEPKKKETAGDQALGLGCIVGFGFVVGVMVGLVLTIIQLIALPDLDFGWGFGIGIAVCTIGSIALGISTNKESAEQTESTYDERLASYKAELSTYERYQQRLRDNPTRNEPLVVLSSGRFVSSMEAEYAKSGLDWRDF